MQKLHNSWAMRSGDGQIRDSPDLRMQYSVQSSIAVIFDCKKTNFQFFQHYKHATPEVTATLK